jgi:4-hydroxybenzoate polyprenyltransferase
MNRKPVPLFSLAFVKAYGITMRPYLLFISAAAGMAGFAGGPARGAAATLGAFFVFFSAYGFSQGLTDSFQMDTDALSSPYRPLIRGVISRGQTIGVSLAGLSVGGAILFALNPRTLLLALLSVFGLATYTFFKRRWWGGPFYNAWIVALLPIIGMMAAWGTHVAPAPVFWSGALWPIVVGTFFSYANFVLAGYTKDISADRATGYNTLPVVFGWSKTAFASDVFAGLSVLAAGWAIAPSIASGRVFSSRGISILVLAAAAAVLVLAQLELHRVRDEKSAFKPIVNVVRGFILLRLAETVSLRPGWTPAAAVFYLCFEWVLSRRPAKEQV